jgi:hypothetical protein
MVYMTTMKISAIKKRLSYSRKTGLFTRKIAVPRGAVGSVAGTKSRRDGYVHVKIFGKQHKAHRLAWAFITGRWPARDVEHRDTNRSNNRWRNLRLANDSQNQANANKRVDNTSGCKSVSRRKDSGKYRARIQVRKRRLSLGDHRTSKLAHAAYCKAAKKHFGEYARVK